MAEKHWRYGGRDAAAAAAARMESVWSSVSPFYGAKERNVMHADYSP